MAFFDDMKKKVTDVANNVADKTKTSAETVSLTTKVNAEEGKIKNAYTEIGRKYVEAHPADYEDVFQAEIEAINASQAKIAEYKEQIRENRGRMFCETCGKEIAKTEEKCPFCGADNPVGIGLAREKTAKEAAAAAQRAEKEAQRQAEREARQEAQRQAREAAMEKAAQRTAALHTGDSFCPKCGARRAAGADFCVKCGYNFKATPVEPVEKSAASTPVEPVAEKPANSTPVEPVAEKSAASTPATPVAEKPVEPTPTESTPRVCPKCGGEVPDGFTFCPACGNKMD